MGFFSGLKSFGGTVFNFRVTKWLGVDQIKQSTRNIAEVGKSVFVPEQANHVETFEEALVRLNITEEELQQRRKEFTRIMMIYVIAAICFFAYSIFIVVEYNNIMGFIMGFAVTLFTLVQAFRYHFWIFQIKRRKLGCTLREWFRE